MKQWQFPNHCFALPLWYHRDWFAQFVAAYKSCCQSTWLCYLNTTTSLIHWCSSITSVVLFTDSCGCYTVLDAFLWVLCPRLVLGWPTSYPELVNWESLLFTQLLSSFQWRYRWPSIARNLKVVKSSERAFFITKRSSVSYPRLVASHKNKYVYCIHGAFTTQQKF